MAFGNELVELLKAGEDPQGRVAIAPHAKKLDVLTASQERFAQLRARGKSLHDAYVEAGYSPGSREAGSSAACQLAKKPKVAARIDQLKREALGATIMPGTLPADEHPTLLPVEIDPENYTVADIAKALVQNARLAREIGKLDASNAAIKLLAELGGFLEKSGPGRKPSNKTPNKGEVDNDADYQTTSESPIFNILALEVQRASGTGAEARDITPVQEGSGGTAATVSDNQKALRDERGSEPVIGLDELARAFGERVPRPASE